VAIARALAPNPTILLLDEPTYALDPELVSEVLDVIRRLAVEDGLTMMISTRQISFAKEVADRAMFLADGSIVEEGSADDVLSRPKNARAAQFLQIMTHEAAAQAGFKAKRGHSFTTRAPYSACTPGNNRRQA
jgi:polar amino acid transport system permease protein